MKKCPVDENCIKFDSPEELEEAFQKMAEASGEELDGDFTVEGNSGLNYRKVLRWVKSFGVENVYFANSFEHGFVNAFYFDLKKAKNDNYVNFSGANEVSIENGVLRVLFN
jgi:hypothetical protein